MKKIFGSIVIAYGRIFYRIASIPTRQRRFFLNKTDIKPRNVLTFLYFSTFGNIKSGHLLRSNDTSLINIYVYINARNRFTHYLRKVKYL